MKVLLASDLDRTIIPNGEQPESPEARPRLRTLVAREEVTLLYVSGRRRELLQEAIVSYELPLPAYAIGDVGTTIYEVGAEQTWESIASWRDEIAPDWNNLQRDQLADLFADIAALELQEAAAQGDFKLSYYVALPADQQSLLAAMRERVAAAGVRAALIWSIDEQKNIGLLDVLPESATKLHAVQFIRERLEITEQQTVFCGDSGNDIPALTSGWPAVLVKNAPDEVRQQVLTLARERGIASQVYIARGDFLDMNGNYSAGVLEGVAHFFPEIMPWIVS